MNQQLFDSLVDRIQRETVAHATTDLPEAGFITVAIGGVKRGGLVKVALASGAIFGQDGNCLVHDHP